MKYQCMLCPLLIVVIVFTLYVEPNYQHTIAFTLTMVLDMSHTISYVCVSPLYYFHTH